MNTLFLKQLSLPSFCMYCFFSELFITMMVAKWLFSNFVVYCREKSFLFTYLYQRRHMYS